MTIIATKCDTLILLHEANLNLNIPPMLQRICGGRSMGTGQLPPAY